MVDDKMLLWPGGPVFRQSPQIPLGTDSVLLADFAAAGRSACGADLGCGSGILSLLLLWGDEALRMTGLELQEQAAALARENLAANGLSGRGDVLCGDIREVRALFPAGGFDLVVSNPPYFPSGSGARSPDPVRAAAREEGGCTLEELCGAAAWLLRSGGRFCVVHRPERLSELLVAMTAAGLEPKRLRLCCHRPGAAPNLLLAEGRRGGKPGLRIEPALFLCEEDGRESAEYRRIYHR